MKIGIPFGFSPLRDCLKQPDAVWLLGKIGEEKVNRILTSRISYQWQKLTSFQVLYLVKSSLQKNQTLFLQVFCFKFHSILVCPILKLLQIPFLNLERHLEVLAVPHMASSYCSLSHRNLCHCPHGPVDPLTVLHQRQVSPKLYQKDESHDICNITTLAVPPLAASYCTLSPQNLCHCPPCSHCLTTKVSFPNKHINCYSFSEPGFSPKKVIYKLRGKCGK